jgi:hypothetical protein
MTYNNEEHFKIMQQRVAKNGADCLSDPLGYLRHMFDYILCNEIDPAKKNNKRRIGALITAIIKSYKTKMYMQFLMVLLEKNKELELTPLVVRRISRALFNKTCSQRELVLLFSLPERTNHAYKSNNDIANEIIDKTKAEADEYIKITAHTAKTEREKFKKEVDRRYEEFYSK